VNFDIVLGLLLTALALGFITVLVLWSRRTIERIADTRLSSAREIVRELSNGS
jgi:hypothetical protein